MINRRKKVNRHTGEVDYVNIQTRSRFGIPDGIQDVVVKLFSFACFVGGIIGIWMAFKYIDFWGNIGFVEWKQQTQNPLIWFAFSFYVLWWGVIGFASIKEHLNGMEVSFWHFALITVLFIAVKIAGLWTVTTEPVATHLGEAYDFFVHETGTPVKKSVSTKAVTPKSDSAYGTGEYVVVNQERWTLLGTKRGQDGRTGQQWCIDMAGNEDAFDKYSTPAGKAKFLKSCGFK